MVNGGQYGGQRVMFVVQRFAKDVARVDLSSIVTSGVLVPNMWQKVITSLFLILSLLILIELKVSFKIPYSTAVPNYDRISFVSFDDNPMYRIYFDDLVIVSIN